MPDPRPPAWALRWLDRALLRDAFEPAWNDALAEFAGRGAAHGFRLRLRGWLLLLQCLRLRSAVRTPSRPGSGIMEATWRDVRFAGRALRRRPGFAALAAATLALGIGANTAIFSVVSSVLLRALPYADAERLVVVWGDNTRTASPQDPHAADTVKDYMEALASADAVAAFSPQWNFTLVGDGAEPERVPGYYVTASFHDMLGVEPVLGRLIHPDDDVEGASPVALIGYGLWQRRFGGNPGIVGQPLRTTEGSATIIGVLPATFRWREDADVWVPMVHNQFWSAGRRVRLYEIIAHVAPGASPERLAVEASALADRLAAEYPENLGGIGARVVPLLDDIVGPVRPALLVLLGGVGLVLLIACANVASLLLVRGDGRRREVAVRASLGASRYRIARELTAESMLIALAGGMLGFAVAFLGVRALLPFVPAGIPRRDDIAVDGTVLLFSLGLALLTGLVFGLVPVLEAFRADAAETLKDGGRGASGRRRVRSALVVVEVAIAVLIACGASLLLRSFTNLQHVDPGFETADIVTMDLSNLPADAAARIVLMESLYERLGGTPVVTSAGDVTRIPLIGGNITSKLAIETRPVPAEEQPEIDFRRASRDYFATLGIPLVSGRMFGAEDDASAPPVALINEAAAARYFPGEDPVGQRVMFGGGAWVEIIGVIGNVRHLDLAAAPRPEGYTHSLQGPPSSLQLLVRTSTDPRAALPAIRASLRAVAPDVVISRVTTMDEARHTALATPRFNTMLFGLFAALALVLAAIGAYGVMAYTVSQRRREIGVRLSVGARAGDVARMIITDGMKLALAGVAIGLAGAWAGGRALRGMLYDVSPTDIPTLGSAGALLAGVVLLACLASARRATSVDPIEALRVE